MVFYAGLLILSWEKQQRLQGSCTRGWLYFLSQTHSPFNLKDESFAFRLGKRFRRVKYDSLLNRVHQIKYYLASTDDLYFRGFRKR